MVGGEGVLGRRAVVVVVVVRGSEVVRVVSAKTGEMVGVDVSMVLHFGGVVVMNIVVA